jgi:cysteine desulfurase/selenocysteine lyase
MFDPYTIKKDFPIFNRIINNMPLIYLDNAATTHKPQSVIDAQSFYYSNSNANVARGVYTLAEESTDMYESARAKVASFINAGSEEIVFTSNATHSLNLVFWGYLNQILGKGDIALSLISEHHSSLVPLQQVARLKDAEFKVLGLGHDLNFSMEKLEEELKSGKVRVLSIAHVSNVLGTVFPVKKIVEKVHQYGGVVVIDASQSIGHMKLDVKQLGCDFLCFSGHKMCGPQGIGVLYARKDLLQDMTPLYYGGGMITKVYTDHTQVKKGSHALEAGTPNVAGAVGLAAAITYLENTGMDNIRTHEQELTHYTFSQLEKIESLHVVGSNQDRLGIIAFDIKGMHSHDIASVLNTRNICVRSGQHCAMPLHDHLKISASVRASFFIYNTKEDINSLVEGLQHSIKVLAK